MTGIYRRILERILEDPARCCAVASRCSPWEKAWVAARSLVAAGGGAAGDEHERRVIVIGGGLAGITAALDCARGGAEVTLLEARGRLGGAAYSFERDGLVRRQRPARVPALLHRLPGAARGARRRPTA